MTPKKKLNDNEIDKLKKELAEIKTKLETAENSRKRLAADYSNLERRMHDDRAVLEERTLAHWLHKLFPVLDNFYRASTHAPTISLDDDQTTLSEEAFQKIHAYFEGLRQIEKQLETIVADAGLTRIPTQGAHFDHNLHEAISYEACDLPAETVIDEIESGWMLKGKVIKPAKVRVSKG
ncbi:MAG: nucleotide exchange factor GrpE [Candidatus Berkelbacteria bacterium]|nr:MAG: nucleotide exchange factor GrpE [Candidatus Berkelbacteria bacterium]QQG51911.1 MAG: nucleotide exchange factor GrpE [Candidatus Berkelbacteria bacterium]